MTPTLLQGDCVELLPTLAAASVQAFITSPPYWGLRDYGIPPTTWPEVRYRPMSGIDFEVVVPAMVCCLGLEPTPEAFIGHLVHVFRLAAPALANDGTCWVNLGDSYCPTGGDRKSSGNGPNTCVGPTADAAMPRQGRYESKQAMLRSGLKPKDLVGIPWRFALAMQADGWYLRQDIIWHKPNPMPESVTDRCTKAHEYFFLLARSPRYYFNAEDIAEPVASVERQQLQRALQLATEGGLTEAHLNALRSEGLAEGKTKVTQTGSGRNTEEVKRLASEARKVLGGYAREFQRGKHTRPRVNEEDRKALRTDTESRHRSSIPGGQSLQAEPDGTRNKRSVWTVATKPYSEAHFATFPPDLVTPCILASTRPGDVVCDMFSGSGTTGQVALPLGRGYIGIEAKPANIKLHHKRYRGLQYQLVA